MNLSLTVLIITKNSASTLERTLKSLRGLKSKIIIVDGMSIDNTIDIALRYKAKILKYRFNNVGNQRKFGLKQIITNWVLALDSDEVVSQNLISEIIKVINNNKNEYDGYLIPIQSYYLGKPLMFGGENYTKLVLFKTKSVAIESAIIHEKFELKKNKIGILNNKIHHYSYRSIPQVFTKFTDYSKKMAIVKNEEGEASSIKKIILYSLHMFYARFIKDKGYKDGLFRIPLDLGFAYMEFLTYVLLALKPKKK